jgi:hypothetical protein
MSTKKGPKSPKANRRGAGTHRVMSRGVNTGPILADDDERCYSDLVLVEFPACDWLTLSTFDHAEYGSMHTYTTMVDRQRLSLTRQAKRMQYVGQQGDGYFLGEGRQDGLPHFLLQAWGARAQEVLHYALLFHSHVDSVRCTRMDLQVTSGRGHAGDVPAVAEHLRSGEDVVWPGRGPRPQVSYFSHDDERDTLYIGSRVSPRFWRAYNKEVNGELRLRLELEAKGWLGSEFWRAMCDEGERAMPSLLFGELKAMPRALVEMVADVVDIEADGTRVARPIENKVEEARTVAWLMETVLPCLERMLDTSRGAELRRAFGDVL